MARVRFSAWLVSGYAHVFIRLFVVIVRYPANRVRVRTPTIAVGLLMASHLSFYTVVAIRSYADSAVATTILLTDNYY